MHSHNHTLTPHTTHTHTHTPTQTHNNTPQTRKNQNCFAFTHNLFCTHKFSPQQLEERKKSKALIEEIVSIPPTKLTINYMCKFYQAHHTTKAARLPLLLLHDLVQKMSSVSVYDLAMSVDDLIGRCDEQEDYDFNF